MSVEIDDEKIKEEDLKNTIERTLNSLPRLKMKAPMSDVLKMYFGLFPYERNYDEEEIGKKYNLGRTEISQIKNKGLEFLRHGSRSRLLRKVLG